MKDLVEHVAEAIRDSGEGDLSPLAYVDPHKAARAAIIATLHYARENVSNEMIAAGWGQLKRAHLPRLGAGPGVPEAYRAMISVLLQEIGGGKT